MTDPVDQLIERLRKTEHYLHIERKGDDVVALHRYAYTFAILSGLNDVGYENRWCYHDPVTALLALLAWSGEDGTEPDGWHRNPPTGRRRKDGDPATEYVDW